MRLTDWEKPENYDYTQNHDTILWAWEFIRRGSGYRKHYENIYKNYTDESGYNISAVVNTGPDSPDFAIHPKDSILLECWKMRYWLNPENQRPTYLQFTTEDLPPPILIHYKDHTTYERLISLVQHTKNHSLVVVIDLTQPIQNQINTLKKRAKSAQKHITVSNKKTRLNKITTKKAKDWKVYLRVLDAEEAGIRRAKAAENIFGARTAKNDDYLRKWDEALKQAKRMRDEGFHDLIG